MRHRSPFIATTLVLTLLAAVRPDGLSGSASAQTRAHVNKWRRVIDDARRAEIAHYTSELQSADEEERREAVQMLGAMRDAATIPALRAALDDKSDRVRAAALAAMGMLAEPSLAPLVAASLTKDKRPFVRKAAAYALGHFKGGEATAALVAGLRDKDMEVRGAAAVALTDAPDAAAIAPLTQSLSDKSAFVRAHAAAALGANGRAAAQAVPNLVKMLATDEDHEARRQAAAALGRIGEPAALAALERAEHSSDPYLSQAARDAMKQIRSQ